MNSRRPGHGRLAAAGHGRLAAAALAAALGAQIARGDVGPPPSVSSDYDAEFARGAELLESNERARAEEILTAVRRRAAQRAWEARVELLLALDDERRADLAAAAVRLGGFSAAPIGLESYRRERLARVLAASGETARALEEYDTLLRSDEPFAQRPRAALAFATLLERSGAPARSAEVLARTAAATPSAASELAPERLRLALRLSDAAATRRLAREILLDSPLADRSASLSPEVHRALEREEAALSPADRARRGRALVAAGDPKRGVALLVAAIPRAPAAERGVNLLALARGQNKLGRADAALQTAARVPADGEPAFDEARLFRIELELARLGRGTPLPPGDPRWEGFVRRLAELTGPGSPSGVRTSARERLVRLAFDRDDFAFGLEQARQLVLETPGTRAGFEPLWRLAWNTYRSGDCPGARARFESLGALYSALDLKRRLTYWKARCIEREGGKARAALLYRGLAIADPPDLYAFFARRRVPARPPRRPTLPDPSEATATFRRVDELLRLRLFAEASAEARALPSSRGRDLRLAESEFALGRFAAAAQAAKRAFPEMGTADEARVPDGWRRLYYPIEEGGFLADRAREFSLDPGLLRALVRQESLFEANARSRAGALGLTQLLPSTARTVARSVLRVRYRRAFLYDPGVNARIGAAYLRRLMDTFGGNAIYALAAYNGGPARMSGVLAANPGLAEDELFESHPAWESRDYVRRVMLYAESYRELYPG